VKALSALSSSEIENQAGVFSITEKRRCRLLSPFHESHQRISNLAVIAEDTLPSIDLKAYARRGAEARIAELTAELNDIYKAFPDLRSGGASASQVPGGGSRSRKRRGMTAAQKAEVSKRMKAYWAAKRRSK
jgi:hypothetical protein